MKSIYIKPICHIVLAYPMSLMEGSKDTKYTFGEKDVHEGTVQDDDGKRDSEAKGYSPWTDWDD